MSDSELLEFQRSFSNCARQPFDFAQDVPQLHKHAYDRGMVEMIADSRQRRGIDRLKVYNQQYWYRLFTVMQEEFPLLRHLLGVRRLNQLVSEYLQKYPSKSYTLNHLSDRLVGFMREDASNWRPEWIEAAVVDHAYIRVFDAAEYPPIRFSRGFDAMSVRLQLQPHVRIFEEHWDLMRCRVEVREDDEDRQVVAPTPANQAWCLYRTPQAIVAEPLEPLQQRLLAEFQGQVLLQEALEKVEMGCSKSDGEKLEASLESWFARWSKLGWFFAAETAAGPETDPPRDQML